MSHIDLLINIKIDCFNFSFSVSSDSYNEEVYDSDMILDSMKKKMSSLLTKHKDGILCNAFMDIYGVSKTLLFIKKYNYFFDMILLYLLQNLTLSFLGQYIFNNR